MRLCAAGRESVRVVGEQRRRHASISPPPRHTAPAHPSPHSFIGRLVQHGWELVALSQGSRKCAFPDTPKHAKVVRLFLPSASFFDETGPSRMFGSSMLLCLVTSAHVARPQLKLSTSGILRSHSRQPRVRIVRSLAGLDQLAAGLELAPTQVRFLQVATPLASQLLFLSPLPLMDTFRTEGTTRDASALPYAAMCVNGAAWCTYGVLAADPTITVSNVGGLLFGLFYCSRFIKYRSTDSNAPELLAGAVAIVAAIAFAAGTLPTLEARELIGSLGVGFCVLMFSGPLASIQTIMGSCSASSLPIGFTVASFVNCLLWTTYGAAAIHDPLVWGPNAAGLVASLTQLGLYATYGENEDGCAVYN